MSKASTAITEGYKPLWSHNFVADDEEMPELATNEDWRGIMVRARKAHNLTQTQLGDDVGLSQVMVSKIETGEAGSSTFILRICRRLSIPEPMHFANEQQRTWSQMGHVLRYRSPEQYEAALRLVESMVKQLEPQADQPTDEQKPPDGRK